MTVNCRLQAIALWTFIGFSLAAAKVHGAVSAPPKAVPLAAPVQTRSSSAALHAPAAIPLADVATQATTVSVYLGSISALSSFDTKVQEAVREFPQLAALIDRDKPGAFSMAREQPSLAKLQEIEQKWQARQQQLTQWLTVMTARANQLQSALDKIESLQKTWLLTRDAAQSAQVPSQVIQQIDEVLATLKSAKSPLDYRRSSLLVIQDSVARQLTNCDAVISEFEKIQQQAVENILVRDTLPLWSKELRMQAAAQLKLRFAIYGEGLQSDFSGFVTEPPRGFFLQCGLFVILLNLLAFMKRRVRTMSGTEELPHSFGVLEFPLHAALAVSLYFGTTPLLPYPQSIRMVMQVLAILPMIRLARPLASRRLVESFYALALLFTLDTIRQGLAGAPLLEHLMLLTESGIGMAALRNMTAESSVPSDAAGYGLTTRQYLRKGYARLAMPVLAVSFGATVFGYLRLARLLVSTVFGGGMLALALFTFVMVMTGIAAFLLRSWPMNALRMVSRHTGFLERRTNTILVWVAIGSWLLRILDYVGLLIPVEDFGKSVLAARYVRGAFSISLGDVVAFILTIWLSTLIASFICFILNEDVFPRTRTSQGVSYAVTNLLRYLLIVIGFMAALGTLGVTMDRVIILVSALGVGIGFGLQTVVNNFISGLILLFERPVHVGDTVEFGAIYGEVRQIGIRASKVHTWQGADIIVPNSQLVSDSVTNWTLSDQLRRIDLPVGVNYGADPQTVIDLLKGVAQKNPRILAWPECACLMKEFGDSTINFELRAWTDDFSNWSQIRSELAVAVYDAVRAAGMSFPFPQREVRLLRDVRHEPVATALSDVPPAMQSESVGKSGPET